MSPPTGVVARPTRGRPWSRRKEPRIVAAAGRSASTRLRPVPAPSGGSSSAAVARAKAALPSGDEAQRVAALYQVLADPTRTRILSALSAAELSVGDIAALVGLSLSAASHQLKLLRDCGVAGYRKRGRVVLYRLLDRNVARLIAHGLERTQAA